MNKNILIQAFILFLLPLLAGMLTFRFKKEQTLSTKLLLSFSGAYLLGLCFLHLVPEVYTDLGSQTGVFIIIGFFFQIILELISKGVEHGHVHVQAHEHFFPWALLISLCIHSFFEGFPMNHHEHEQESHAMLMGISLHKIPVAIALVSLLKQAALKNIYKYLALIIFCLMAPIGMLSIGFFNIDLLATIQPISMALLIGILLHVATTIIFEISENHKFNAMKFLSIIAGVLLSFLLN